MQYREIQGVGQCVQQQLRAAHLGRQHPLGIHHPTQLQQAAAACAKKLEPTVQPYAAPARMVRSEAELEAWLDEVRQAVKAKLQSGPVQF